MHISREELFSAADEAGFHRVHTCCEDVHLKVCGTDEWRGDLGALAAAILRRSAQPEAAHPAPLSEAQLDYIARSYFAEELDQQHVKHAIEDAFKAAQPAPMPVAWMTFDGEGGYDLRLYEDNEDYRDEYIKRNGEKYSGWVKPLFTAAENTHSANPRGWFVIDYADNGAECLTHIYKGDQGAFPLYSVPSQPGLEKDAERYRWLRSSDRGMASISCAISDYPEPPYFELKSDEELDKAIDAAIADSRSADKDSK